MSLQVFQKNQLFKLSLKTSVMFSQLMLETCLFVTSRLSIFEYVNELSDTFTISQKVSLFGKLKYTFSSSGQNICFSYETESLVVFLTSLLSTVSLITLITKLVLDVSFHEYAVITYVFFQKSNV